MGEFALSLLFFIPAAESSTPWYIAIEEVSVLLSKAPVCDLVV